LGDEIKFLVMNKLNQVVKEEVEGRGEA